MVVSFAWKRVGLVYEVPTVKLNTIAINQLPNAKRFYWNLQNIISPEFYTSISDSQSGWIPTDFIGHLFDKDFFDPEFYFSIY